MNTTETLAESAHRVMAEHPSRDGWQRTETAPCSGVHGPLPFRGQSHVMWRRRRDRVDADYHGLTYEEDPPLWVVEQVSPALCITDLWVWRVRDVVGPGTFAHKDMGLPWTFDEGPLRPGFKVTLTVANGAWVWTCGDEEADCCGGYTGRWPD